MIIRREGFEILRFRHVENKKRLFLSVYFLSHVGRVFGVIIPISCK